MLGGTLETHYEKKKTKKNDGSYVRSPFNYQLRKFKNLVELNTFKLLVSIHL